jgi:hypothetical protein
MELTLCATSRKGSAYINCNTLSFGVFGGGGGFDYESCILYSGINTIFIILGKPCF